MKNIKRIGILVISIALGLMTFSNTALAARTSNELILANELAAGEIVTVQIATGTNKDAIVVKEGETPRLVLLENLGSDYYYKYACYSRSDCAYDVSDLKTVMDSRTSGHASYMFNISAPFINDINNYGDVPSIIEAKLVQNGGFWTRTPWSGTYFRMWVADTNGSITYMDSNNNKGVRPAFNLKSDTILIYSSGKFTVTTTTANKASLLFKQRGFDSVIYVPQGQTPAGYTALTGYTGVYYKEFSGQFLFVYAQSYIPPTTVDNLNIQ